MNETKRRYNSLVIAYEMARIILWKESQIDWRLFMMENRQVYELFHIHSVKLSVLRHGFDQIVK